MNESGPDAIRREMLKLAAAVAGTAAVTTLAVPGASRAATPSCDAGRASADATPRQTEGPYFTRKSPLRASLVEPGLSGTRMVLSGRVLTTDCRPIPKALLDVWQADAAGDYDNAGYRLRGHLFADDDGRYRLETIVPGFYPGRTRHIHVKVQPPNGPVLTTQLYFPADEARNRRDFLYAPALLVAVPAAAPVMTATFDFVIATG